MKILVIGGSGKIGSAIVHDLSQQKDVEVVGIAGNSIDALENIAKWVDSDKAVLHTLNIMDTKGTNKIMCGYDVVVISLVERMKSYKAVEAVIDTGLKAVDILEEYHRRPEPHEIEGLEVPEGMILEEYGELLHQRAVENDATLIDGLGFAPGLSNITLGEGIRKLDKAESAIARVGGIPAKEAAGKHPLKYTINWNFKHVLREYTVRVKVLKDGKPIEIEALSEREKFRFTQFGRDEELECAVTPGMPSFPFTRPNLTQFVEKTIRWPGHWEEIETLKECGLLDLVPVNCSGVKIVPRHFLLSVIESRLKPLEGDTDVSVMWNTITGLKNGKRARIDYYMWDEADTEKRISSMARITGFTAAIGAVMLGKGIINERGIVAPEDCIKGQIYSQFIDELRKRNINIIEVHKIEE